MLRFGKNCYYTTLLGYLQVAITLSDINDHSPEFTDLKLELSRKEGYYDNVTLTKVFARDADSGENAHITYSVISGNEGKGHVGVSKQPPFSYFCVKLSY